MVSINQKTYLLKILINNRPAPVPSIIEVMRIFFVLISQNPKAVNTIPTIDIRNSFTWGVKSFHTNPTKDIAPIKINNEAKAPIKYFPISTSFNLFSCLGIGGIG